MAEGKTTLVKFIADVFPYCKNDVVALTDDELKRVDTVAKARDLGKAYETVKESK